MDSKFLFGIESVENEEKSNFSGKSEEIKEIITNISEELEFAQTQFCTLKQQMTNMDIGTMKRSFYYRKCCLLAEYLNNVYLFHTLKTHLNESEKLRILRRLNDLKSVLDRLCPLESRLDSYLKDLSKLQQHQDQLKSKKSTVLVSLNEDMTLRPNLGAFMENSQITETEKLNPKLSNLVVSENTQQTLSDIEDNDQDMIEKKSKHKSGSKSLKWKNTESSVYVPSKSKYVPYEDTQNKNLTPRQRKEIQEGKQHKLELQKSIVDDLMSVDNDIPITSGMTESSNAGYFERHNLVSKSNLKRDLGILKDRNYTLMMNDDQDEFIDKNLEQLNKVLTSKLNSKKHQQKLAKRRELRVRFRKRKRN